MTARRGWSLVVAVVMLAVGWASQAEAQYFGQNKIQYRQYDWRSMQSDHFEVYYYPGEDSLAMRVMDLAEKTQAVFSRRLQHELSKRIPIILYGSHNDFQQTNVTPDLIDPGTGGFTELLRDRVVIPFTGSYEDLRHVLVHELVHAFQFDILYNGPGTSLISRQGFFQMPLWFAEGMAEYLSLGMEPNAEMICRDGTLTGYLPPLEYASGYIVYKMGQSALTYLVERYGEERFREVLKRARQMRSFERAFQRTYDMPVSKFDEQWREHLRKQYWPTVAERDNPETFAKRLTDHRRDQSNVNLAPAVSPDGDRIAYFSDRRQYTDVFVMNAFDGKVLRRVIRGERDVAFESIPSFRSSLTWSPDGSRLALVAQARGYDKLYVVDASSGKIEKRFDLGCESLAFPAWSPTGDSIAVMGVKDGRADLYLVASASGTIRRLTDDAWDEKEPTWSPDGRRITFSSDRLAPVVLHPVRQDDSYGRYAIYDLDVASGQVTRVVDTAGEDHAPAWSPDGRKLAFITDRDGAPNLYLHDGAAGTVTQLTNVLGGVTSVSWSRRNDRLVFSAFNRGGYDVFAVQQPLGTESVLQKLRRDAPLAVMSVAEAEIAAPRDTARVAPRAVLAVAWPDSMSAPDSSLASQRPRPRREPGALPPPVAFEPPSWAGDFPPQPTAMLPAAPDTVKREPRPVLTPLLERGGPFALSDSVLSQSPTPYRWRLQPEYFNGGFLAATGYGFVGLTQLVFADFLGDRQLQIATDVFSASLSESNALVLFNYLPKRWDVQGGVFHFKNYYSSRVTTLGEALGSPQLFSERSFGALAGASYPFDRFRRMDFEFTQMFVQREFFEEDEFGDFIKTRTDYRSISSPSVSLVGDNSLFGYYGPVNGSRWNLTYSPSFAWFSNGLAYQTATLDVRRYWDLTGGYTLALRSLDGASFGRDPQTFRVGGFSTLRGYRDFDLLGNRVAIGTAELRFPFIQQLGLVGPLPIGFFNLKGAMFADAGMVWDRGEESQLRFTEVVNGTRRLASPKFGFGTGIRSWFLIGLIKLDVAWPTDFKDVGKPRWHFSIGPEF